jgi:transketolase
MIEFTPNLIMEMTRLGTRKAFGFYMKEIAADHPDMLILSADTSSSANLGLFISEYPDRFYNIGIAEQNMTGIAAGLAKEGNNVFICSFAPFVSMRNYEAIRSLIGYMHLNVKIIGLASGFSLGAQGNTHYCLEDISLMKTIPGLKVFSPADVVEEGYCLNYLADYDGPAYVRLTGIDGSPAVFKSDYVFSPEDPTLLYDGDEIIILATGSIVSECVRAARLLKKEGLSAGVYNICQIKAGMLDPIIDKIDKAKLIVTVEEHFRTGGLGGTVCEENCSLKNPKRVLRIGINGVYPHAGDYAYLQDVTGISSRCIVEQIVNYVKDC